MRHREKRNKLGRNASHRLATLRSLSTALLKNKKIKTTLSKAKATRTFVEPLITKAKNDTLHARRDIARDINDKEVVKELFGEIIEKIGDRPGGYTRVVKLGYRFGDSAEMALLELVDYNEITPSKKKKSKKEKGVKDETPAAKSTAAETELEEETVEEAKIIEESVEETEDDVKEEIKEEAKEETSDNAEVAEEEETEDKTASKSQTETKSDSGGEEDTADGDSAEPDKKEK